MSDPVDWTDPCQRFQALSTAYYQLIAGLQEVEIKTRTLDAEEMVRFSRADIQSLRAEMRSAESACAKAQGISDPNRRFAIGCTYRPRGYPTSYDPTDPRG